MRQARQTVKDLMMGLGIWGVLVFVVLEIISRHRIAMAAGLLAGLLTAAGLIFHMYHHLDIALDLDSGQARKHAMFASMQRLAVMAVVLAVSMTQYRYLHPLGVVLGIYGVKISALIQPLLQRYRRRQKKQE